MRIIRDGKIEQTQCTNFGSTPGEYRFEATLENRP